MVDATLKMSGHSMVSKFFFPLALVLDSIDDLNKFQISVIEQLVRRVSTKMSVLKSCFIESAHLKRRLVLTMSFRLGHRNL